jgi:hypothetical protein
MAIRLQAVDANGERWRSSARFRADRRGRLALDRDAPVSASYRGIWGAGLLTSLVSSADGGTPFFWPRTGTTTLRFDVVAGGHTIASDEVRRGLPEVKSNAVLIFGGSEGGLSFRLVPALLAGHSVGELLPYIPGAGRLAPADERAREDLWPEVVSFLARG